MWPPTASYSNRNKAWIHSIQQEFTLTRFALTQSRPPSLIHTQPPHRRPPPSGNTFVYIRNATWFQWQLPKQRHTSLHPTFSAPLIDSHAPMLDSPPKRETRPSAVRDRSYGNKTQSPPPPQPYRWNSICRSFSFPLFAAAAAATNRSQRWGDIRHPPPALRSGDMEVWWWPRSLAIFAPLGVGRHWAQWLAICHMSAKITSLDGVCKF